MPRVPFSRPDHEPRPEQLLTRQHVVTTALLLHIQSRSPYLQVAAARMAEVAPDGVHMIVICEPVVNNGPDQPDRPLLVAQLRLICADGTTDIIHTVIPVELLVRLPTAEKMLASYAALIPTAGRWVDALTPEMFDDDMSEAERADGDGDVEGAE